MKKLKLNAKIHQVTPLKNSFPTRREFLSLLRESSKWCLHVIIILCSFHFPSNAEITTAEEMKTRCSNYFENKTKKETFRVEPSSGPVINPFAQERINCCCFCVVALSFGTARARAEQKNIKGGNYTFPQHCWISFSVNQLNGAGRKMRLSIHMIIRPRREIASDAIRSSIYLTF